MGGNLSPHLIGVRVFIEMKGWLNLSQTGLLSGCRSAALDLQRATIQAMTFPDEEAGEQGSCYTHEWEPLTHSRRKDSIL